VGRNLFTITNDTGFHPDITALARGENTLSFNVDPRVPNGDPSLFKGDSYNYPLRRTFSVSIKITF